MISMLSSTDVTGRNVSRQNSLKRQLIRVHTRHSGRVSKRGNEKLLQDAPHAPLSTSICVKRLYATEDSTAF